MTLLSPGDRADSRGHFLDELRATVVERAGRPALTHRDRTYSYAELDRRARRCAGWLQGLGVERGDRVAVAAAEKLPFLAAHLGAIYAGACSLPLNPRFTRDEFRYFLADSGARVAVVGAGLRPVVEGLRPELPDLRGRRRRRRVGGARGPGSRPLGRRGRPLPDPLQLRHHGPAQGGRPHARQPRRQPARPAGLLAIHARGRHGQRAAAVPHPRPLVRHPPQPAHRRVPAHGGRLPPAPDPGGRGQGHGLHGDPDVLLRVPRPAGVRRGRPGLGARPAVHLRLGADPARGPARAWRRSWAARRSTAMA